MILVATTFVLRQNTVQSKNTVRQNFDCFEAKFRPEGKFWHMNMDLDIQEKHMILVKAF